MVYVETFFWLLLLEQYYHIFMASSMIGIMGFKWGIPLENYKHCLAASIFIRHYSSTKTILNRLKKYYSSNKRRTIRLI